MEIEFKDVSFKYKLDNKKEEVILDNINFKIDNSKIHAFIGNSCSGKSLLAELISALVKPTRGTILIDNKAINSKKIKNINSLRSNIGYIYKIPNDMFLTNNVKSEIGFGLKYYKYKLEIIDKRIMDSLTLVGLDESYLNKSINSLSLSEKKKVAIAAVLTYNPKVVIFDEPTIGFNEKDKKELIRLIRNLKVKYNKTVIVLTKDVDFAYRTCNNIFILSDGNIVSEGNEEILTDKNLLDKYDLFYPKCLDFVNIANEKKNANLEYYKEVGDLIKGVYRSVY